MKNIISKEFYLDYVNNYLTVAKIAESYNITEKEANRLIKVGRKENEQEAIIKKALQSNKKRLDKENWQPVM